MKKIVGLIAGRHEMPVSEYIFDNAIEDVFNFDEMESIIYDFINKVREAELVVYVTGLTCVTAQLIKVCYELGIGLTLMHFDNVSGEYIPQKIK